MARFDQHMGLNEWARDFVEGDPVVLYHEESVRTYPDGHKEFVENRPIMGSTVSREPSDQCYEGMGGDQYPLWRYKFLDGRIFEERVQADPWSSGPMFYLALVEIVNGQENWLQNSLWSEFLDVAEEEGMDDDAEEEDLLLLENLEESNKIGA